MLYPLSYEGSPESLAKSPGSGWLRVPSEPAHGFLNRAAHVAGAPRGRP